MRKENRYILGGIALGALVAAFIDGLIQADRLISKGESFEFNKLNWQEIGLASLGGGALGGLAGYGIYQHSQEELANPNQFLKDLVANMRVDFETLQNEHLIYEKTQEIIDYLTTEFFQEFSEPIKYVGSASKGTAIRGNHDVDISLRFKHSSFKTLEQMSDNVYDVLAEYNDIHLIEVRKQSKSIGLIFEIDGEQHKIDIVPARQTPNKDGYNLYKRADSYFDTSSRVKTNTDLHKIDLANKPSKLELVTLFKLYKQETGLLLKSIAMEQLILKAFEKGYCYPQQNIKARFLGVLSYVRDYLPTIKLVDPANSNNDLLANLGNNERQSIVSQIDSDINRISVQSGYWAEIFENSNAY